MDKINWKQAIVVAGFTAAILMGIYWTLRDMVDDAVDTERRITSNELRINELENCGGNQEGKQQ